MVYIGLIGEQGAGKGTVAGLLKEMIETVGFSRVTVVKFSGVLSRTLGLWGIEQNRTNLQNLAICMNNMFGEGTLSQAVFYDARRTAHKEKCGVIIFDGVRWDSDFQMLASNPFHHSIYVTADQRIRYERVLLRNEKPGEQTISFEEFSAAERVFTETLIPVLGAQADYTIYNNKGLDNLRARVEILCERMFAIRL